MERLGFRPLRDISISQKMIDNRTESIGPESNARTRIRACDIHRPARAIISGVLINLILPMKYDNNNL